jgi:phospholipid transport system substrate-binding protein
MTCTSTKSRRCADLALALALVLPLSAAAATPRETVTTMADAVIKVLKGDTRSTADKRAEVERIVYGAVDFDTLSRLVMARNWSRLSPAQQDEFRREFRRHLSTTYGRRVESYSNETVDVTGEREEARGDHTVKTVIRRGGGNADIQVDYRLRQVGGQWKIIDFVIEGVSLVANFRSQFQEIMSSGGATELLAALRKKNAEEAAEDVGG